VYVIMIIYVVIVMRIDTQIPIIMNLKEILRYLEVEVSEFRGHFRPVSRRLYEKSKYLKIEGSATLKFLRGRYRIAERCDLDTDSIRTLWCRVSVVLVNGWMCPKGTKVWRSIRTRRQVVMYTVSK